VRDFLWRCLDLLSFVLRLVPEGLYCYTWRRPPLRHGKVQPCRFYYSIGPDIFDGRCRLLPGAEVMDACKSCGLNEGLWRLYYRATTPSGC